MDYNFNTKINGNITLTAIWEKNKSTTKNVTIKFNSNGGTIVENQIIEKGNVVKQPKAPTKEGYSFVEWQLDSKTYNFETKVEQDIELVAKWKENEKTESNSTTKPTENKVKKYTVTFNSNGGSKVSSQIVVEGNKVSKPQNPTREEYTFVGWTLNGSEYNFNTSVKSNITLVANWKEEINVATPTLSAGLGGPIERGEFAEFTIELTGHYAPPGIIDTIAGWELYEKVGNNYNLIKGKRVEVENGDMKTYVARAYILNKAGNKIYSAYSNEHVIDRSEVEKKLI